MSQMKIQMNVRRINAATSIIDVQGDISATAEPILTDAYTQASTSTTRVIIMNFSGLTYMNSSGIGLLVMLLVRIKRQKQSLLAYGLSEHYRRIFEITRLSDAIPLYATEQDALTASQQFEH